MSQFVQSKSGKAGFIAAVALLGAAAVAFNVLTRTMDLHFKKQPVALRAPLKSIPEQMGDWVQVSKDQPLGHDVEDALAANEYIFRDRKTVVTAAGLLAEIGDNRARYPTNDTLAADAGQSPVTIQSGNTFSIWGRAAVRKSVIISADNLRSFTTVISSTFA